MKYIHTRSKFINEKVFTTKFKYMNLLYHSFNLVDLVSIYYNNQLYPKTEQTFKTRNETLKGCSLTRNPNLNYLSHPISIILDQDKIKRVYGKKLVPFDYFAYNDKKEYNSNESEEFLIGGLQNLSKYLLGFKVTSEADFIDDLESANISKYDIETIFRDYPLFDSNWDELDINSIIYLSGIK